MINSQQTLQCKGKILDISTPIIMGILNITPDSFFEQSRQMDINAIAAVAGKMLEEGADIVDIGGMSSRPGAKIITIEEELERVIPAIKTIIKKHPSCIISIDTVHAQVAKEAIFAGASMVNDISAGKIDDEMYSTVADLGVPYVLMHMKGKPENMQRSTDYKDVTKDVLDFLIKEVFKLRNLGIKDIIIDPGFGFGKTIDQNYKLLQQLHIFKILDCPVLAGLSRKSMIYTYLNTSPEKALNGTTALNLVALQQGAKILRVHDVKEAKETILLWKKLEH